MNTSALPFHKRLRHPHTGEPLQAIYRDKRGHLRWPVIGADDNDDKAAADKAAADKAAADKAAADKAAADKAAADKAVADEADKDLGFPKDTPVAEMKPTEQAAYYRQQSRKQEERNKALLAAAGGKTPEELTAEREELERLRNEKRTDGEKAVEKAKQETREEVTREFTPKLVRLAFNTALAHVADEDRKDLVDSLDLSKFIDSSGDVDLEKVSTMAAKIAPAGKGAGGRIDYGGGRRETTTSSGAAAGRDRYEERHGKKKATA